MSADVIPGSATVVEVVCPGMLEVLSVGRGDLKLTFGADDVERARTLIEEMLRKGYTILVETDDGPTRVKQFNPKRLTYVIAELVAEPDTVPPAETTEPPKARRRTVRDREVPLAGSRATAIGRTSGG